MVCLHLLPDHVFTADYLFCAGILAEHEALYAISAQKSPEVSLKASSVVRFGNQTAVPAMTAFLILSNCSSNGLSKSSFNIFAPSDLATAGLGWVSIKSPSAPTATAAFAMVAMSLGFPPVTPPG